MLLLSGYGNGDNSYVLLRSSEADRAAFRDSQKVVDITLRQEQSQLKV